MDLRCTCALEPPFRLNGRVARSLPLNGHRQPRPVRRMVQESSGQQRWDWVRRTLCGATTNGATIRSAQILGKNIVLTSLGRRSGDGRAASVGSFDLRPIRGELDPETTLHDPPSMDPPGPSGSGTFAYYYFSTVVTRSNIMREESLMECHRKENVHPICAHSNIFIGILLTPGHPRARRVTQSAVRTKPAARSWPRTREVRGRHNPHAAWSSSLLRCRTSHQRRHPLVVDLLAAAV
jgi:hypothetical protein